MIDLHYASRGTEERKEKGEGRRERKKGKVRDIPTFHLCKISPSITGTAFFPSLAIYDLRGPF